MYKVSIKKRIQKSLKAFSLVELMIVVAILGILAAIVMPEFQNQSQRAKEAAAKDNLRILREAIERYGNDPTKTAASAFVLSQLTITNNYLSEIPENPLNGYSAFYIVPSTGTITDGMAVGSAQGWVYQPSTKTIKINLTGTDSQGNNYFDY